MRAEDTFYGSCGTCSTTFLSSAPPVGRPWQTQQKGTTQRGRSEIRLGGLAWPLDLPVALSLQAGLKSPLIRLKIHENPALPGFEAGLQFSRKSGLAIH